jgi:hypothetical protein
MPEFVDDPLLYTNKYCSKIDNIKYIPQQFSKLSIDISRIFLTIYIYTIYVVYCNTCANCVDDIPTCQVIPPADFSSQSPMAASS